MMTPDLISQVLVCTAIGSFFFFAINYKNHRESKGTSLWIAALALLPAALYLTTFNHQSLLNEANFLGELLMSLVLLLITIGVKSFFDQPKRILLLSLFFITNISALLYFTFHNYNIDIHNLIYSLYTTIMLTVIIISAILARGEYGLFSRVLLTIVAVIIISLTSLSTYGHFYPTVLTNQTSFLLLITAGFISHYGFSLSFCTLCNERNVEQLSANKRTIYQYEKEQESHLNQQNNHPEPTTTISSPEESLSFSAHAVLESPLDPTIEAEGNFLISEPEESIEAPSQNTDLMNPQFLNITSLRWQQSVLKPQEIKESIEQLSLLLNETNNQINQFNIDQKTQPIKDSLRMLSTNADKLGLEQLAELAFNFEFNLPTEIDKNEQENLLNLGKNGIECLRGIIEQLDEQTGLWNDSP